MNSPGDTRTDERDREAGPDEQGSPEEERDEAGHPALERAKAAAEEECARLQGGSELKFLGGTLPLRGLAAMAVFLAVFLLAWVGLWAAMGGIGLALGWIPATVIAIAGVVLVSRAIWARSGPGSGASGPHPRAS